METADKVKVLWRLAKTMRAVPEDCALEDLLREYEASGVDPEQALRSLIVEAAKKGRQ